jgi:hypothetical protein
LNATRALLPILFRHSQPIDTNRRVHGAMRVSPPSLRKRGTIPAKDRLSATAHSLACAGDGARTAPDLAVRSRNPSLPSHSISVPGSLILICEGAGALPVPSGVRMVSRYKPWIAIHLEAAHSTFR